MKLCPKTNFIENFECFINCFKCFSLWVFYFFLKKKCSFCSVSISRGVILQSSHSDSHSAFVLSVLTFFGVLDKGVTGLFTGVLYLGVDGLCFIGEKDIDFGVVGLRSL